ncbi:hypothetical protein AVEN_54040-1 [Araneus ventricosus]|uniref:Uncharacterized protein n=1 Tax=Araneus ventricosus TaxID=182803 RepID=A0A4Y2EJY9_ARAVE|nr:hypothetical protein AVEN_54040-1 [Araneus ventricosus]
MENELSELETLPNLFNKTGSEIDFVHFTSSESINDSEIRSLKKLNIYNLTPTKQVHCVLWNENLSGRAGNDIASTFPKILTVLAQEKDRTELKTGSDS